MWLKTDLEAGLYVVSSPIGAARDITLRALDVLANCNMIAAEDTRVTRRLLDIHGISLGNRQVLSYHEHSSPKVRETVLDRITKGEAVAYVSDAGTPLIADPGFQLVKAARETGLKVIPVPGASAPIAALTMSGLASDRFMFVGFLPNAKAARRRELAALADIPATLIFFENPKRLNQFFSDCVEILGTERSAAVAREITKRFEECKRGTLGALRDHYVEATPKGECVVLIERAPPRQIDEATMREMLVKAMEIQSLKDAVASVASVTGLSRRLVYNTALELEKHT